MYTAHVNIFFVACVTNILALKKLDQNVQQAKASGADPRRISCLSPTRAPHRVTPLLGFFALKGALIVIMVYYISAAATFQILSIHAFL